MLPDILRDQLSLVICGTAAGTRSARVSHYYAGNGNQFWPTLHLVGITPRQLESDEDSELLNFGVGLTDLHKTQAGMNHSLNPAGFDVAKVREIVARYRPRFLAFNGKNAASVFLGVKGRTLSYGRYGGPCQICGTTQWVLPSTSGAARRYWDLRPWKALAEEVECYRCKLGRP